MNLRTIASILILLAVGVALYLWLSTPAALDGQQDGIAEWQAASARQQSVTAKHYVDFWAKQNGTAPGSVTDMRECIGRNITPDQGVMSTAAHCALVEMGGS